MSSLENKLIEHIVLLKIKTGIESTTVIDKLNGLSSIDILLHFSVGELLRSSHSFTHIVHCRFRSKDDFQIYHAHPHHLSVADETIPLVDDVMIVDWLSSNADIVDSPKPGSAMRVRLLKLKDDSIKHNKLVVIQGIKNQFKGMEEVIIATSVGENFCHEMDENISVDIDKGYAIGSIAFVPTSADFAVLDSKVDNNKLNDLIESEVVVDYVFPSSAN